MKRLKRLVLVAIFLNVSYLTSYAWIMGSDMSWSCLGGDSFLIKVAAYNDCNGMAMVNFNVYFNCSSTGTWISTLSLTTPTPVDITPVCNNTCTRCQSSSCSFPYGVNRYLYQGIVGGGTYDVIYHYIDSNQCGNEDTVKITVIAKPPTPVISLSPSDSFLECNLLNGSYKWCYTTDTFTAPTTINNNSNRIDPNLYCKNCYFNVIFTDTNGCVSNTSAFFYFVINSIDKNNHLSPLVFYPNPAHSELFIENRDNESASFTMTDIFGKTLLEKKIIPGKSTIPIRSFKPGIYFIFMNKAIAGKLIIE